MGTIGRTFRRSWFMTNKVYLFLIMIFLAVANSVLAALGFAAIFFLYLYKIFRSRLPLDPDGNFKRSTRVYKKAGSLNLKLDIWYPRKTSSSYSVVFFTHGGGWVSGFRNQPNNISWGRFLASRGFAVVSIDYRYGFTSTMEEILSDYADALDYIRENAGPLRLDTNNIILMGLSAGGHLALLYAAYYTYMENEEKTSGLRGVVAYYAPSDLSDIFSPEDKSIFARFATAATMKGTPRSDADTYRYYSPIQWISERMVPAVIVHGRLDTVVPFPSSTSLANMLKDKGVQYRFLIHNEGGHGFETKNKDLRTTGILIETIRSMKGMLRHDH